MKKISISELRKIKGGHGGGVEPICGGSGQCYINHVNCVMDTPQQNCHDRLMQCLYCNDLPQPIVNEV
jgi:hypothetical protein